MADDVISIGDLPRLTALEELGRPLTWKERDAFRIICEVVQEALDNIAAQRYDMERRLSEMTKALEIDKMDAFADAWTEAQYELEDARQM